MAEGRTGQRQVEVGVTSGVVSRLQPIARRVLFVLTKVSTGGQTITVSIGQDATAGNGIVLGPGGFYSESADAGFTPTNDDIYAISDLAGGLLAVSERVDTQRVM